MTTTDLSRIIRALPLFQGLPDAVLATVVGCARNVSLPKGTLLGREGERQDQFALVRSGRIAIETAVPGRGSLVLQSLGPGEVVGWSWIFPPHLWQFDARAAEETLAVVFDAACLRAKCDADHSLGYELMKRMASIMALRLRAARLQLMDLYGPAGRQRAGAAI